jgi:hypothetical protein
MRILDSARKHGIADEDMLHAARHAVRAITQDRDGEPTLLIGPDRAGRHLELVVADLDSEDPRIVHADVLRRTFYRFL